MDWFYSFIIVSSDPFEAWAEWFTMRRALAFCSLASLYPLIMAILALKNGGGGHWHCLWVLSLIGLFFDFFSFGGDFFALGVVWLLAGFFIFHGQRELHQMTDDDG